MNSSDPDEPAYLPYLIKSYDACQNNLYQILLCMDSKVCSYCTDTKADLGLCYLNMSWAQLFKINDVIS